MIYCTSCGVENSNENSFCTNCGADLKSNTNIIIAPELDNEVDDDIETQKIKNALNRKNNSISWRNKRCPICKTGKIRRSKPIMINRKRVKQYTCNDCQSLFTQFNKNYMLTKASNDYPGWNDKIKLTLSKFDWIRIAYNLYDENSLSTVTNNESAYPEILTPQQVNEKLNKVIAVSFYESMPGRVSLGNNKSYIHGILEIADNEILIHKKSLWRGKDRGKKHIRYDRITSVDFDAGKFLGAPSIQVYLSSVEYSFRSNDKRLESFYNMIREKIDEIANQVNTPVSNVSAMDELKKLAELRDLGIVTEEEFQEKKKQLLNL